MTYEKSREGRRKLLKSIAAGSGAIVAGKSLPESWSRPVVNSVLLPAHAVTSCPVLVNATPSSLTVQAISGAPGTDLDGIEILFDGCSVLTMVAGDDPGPSGDSLAFFDADSAQPNVFDVETGPAANWNMISNTFGGLPISNVAEGPHGIRVQRLTGSTTGTVFDILFDVAVPGLVVAAGVEMTVSNLRAIVV